MLALAEWLCGVQPSGAANTGSCVTIGSQGQPGTFTILHGDINTSTGEGEEGHPRIIKRAVTKISHITAGGLAQKLSPKPGDISFHVLHIIIAVLE